MIGVWMGSQYGIDGRRWDHHLFLDHDGRYEWTVRRESDYERRDAGHWEYDEAEKVLQLQPEMADESGPTCRAWRVLSVTTCEDSNVLLVLRALILASRNLPILFYRVHCNGKAYGTGWEERPSDHSA
ncbi:MAG: hypothetical protein ACRELG_03485 [Gemmataceae bacterium]